MSRTGLFCLATQLLNPKRESALCPGVTVIYNGSYVLHGYCALTDSDGDKIYGPSEGKGPAEGFDLIGVVTYEGGTGKYRGIQGSHTYKCSGIGTDGQAFCRQEASYRLP